MARLYMTCRTIGGTALCRARKLRHADWMATAAATVATVWTMYGAISMSLACAQRTACLSSPAVPESQGAGRRTYVRAPCRVGLSYDVRQGLRPVSNRSACRPEATRVLREQRQGTSSSLATPLRARQQGLCLAGGEPRVRDSS